MSIRGVKAMKSYVYLDVLFFVNLIANYVMLFAAGKMMGKSIQRNKAIMASCLGGFYSLGALALPHRICFSFPARIIFGLFMIVFAYPHVRGVSFVALSISFYACSALAAGTAMAFYMWCKPAFFSYRALGQIQWWTVALAFITVVSSGFLWRTLNPLAIKGVPFVEIEIMLGNRSVSMIGMVDTGNSLKDPVSGLPVIIVDWDSLKPIMPGETSCFFLSAWDLITSKITELTVAKKLRLIPFTGLSGNKGILPGFKPDALYLTLKEGKLKKDAVIGVSGELLNPQGLYQALLHPELMNP